MPPEANTAVTRKSSRSVRPEAVPVNAAAVVSNVFSLTIGAGIAQCLLAISLLLTARQLGSEQFGEYAASFSAAGLTSIAVNLGLDTWLLQKSSGDGDQIGKIAGYAIKVKTIVGFPWIIGLMLILPILNPKTFSAPLVLISALSVWAEGFFATGLSVFKTLLRNRIAALLLIGARCGFLLLTLLLFTANARGPMIFAIMRLIPSLVAACVTFLLLPIKPIFEPPLSLQSLRELLPFAISDLLASVYMQADVTITAIFLGKEATGLYAPSVSIVNALFVIPTAWYSVTIPFWVRIIGTNRNCLQKALLKHVGGFAALGLSLWIGLRCCSPLLPFILGQDFERSVYLLAILSPILFFKAGSFALAAVLVAAGLQKVRVCVQTISALINVGLNLLIIHHLGVTGVAIVYVISEALLLIGYSISVIYWLQHVAVRFHCGSA